MKNKVVVYCCTPNWFLMLKTAINSLLINNPDVEKVIIFTSGAKFDLIKDERIEQHNISDQKYQIFDGNGPNLNSCWGPMSLTRLGLPLWLPYDEVLYLDVDTIVDGPLTELWELDLTDKMFAGVPEPAVTAKIGSLYYNSGVLLMNIKKLRKVAPFMIQRVNKYKLDYPDQDVLNEFGALFSIQLDPKFNATHFIPSDEIIIKHYADAHDKWRTDALYKKYEEG